LKLKNLKQTTAIGMILLSAASVFGFDATMKINPPVIELSESAELIVEVRNAKNPQQPVLPDIPGLRIDYTGESANSRWINGKSDSYTAYSYSVYPQKTGTFTIGPFNYTIGNETKILQGELKVVQPDSSSTQVKNWADILFARLSVDRSSVYVQEPFELTLAIYSRQGLQLVGNLSIENMPKTGLSEFKWQELDPSRDVINNTVYDVHRFRAQIRGLHSGTFEFNPTMTVQVVVPNQTGPRHRLFDDPFFNPLFYRAETRPVDVAVEKTSIVVKPLPEEDQPPGFSGAIGQFDFQVSAQPVDVHPGDPITLTMRITGDGNLDHIAAPPFPEENSFRLYGDPQKKEEEHTVVFEQVISPRSAEATQIPPIRFSFFDTRSGRYKTLNSDPIPVTVTASSNNTAQVFAAKESLVLPPPETPFATESDLQQITVTLETFWQKIRAWLWLIPGVLAIFLAAVGSRKLHHHHKKDTARIRRQKAPKAARKALRKARHARHQGNTAAFYDALWNTLAEYFGNRLNLPPGDIDSPTILQALKQAAVDGKQIDKLRSVFEHVEASRYGLPNSESTSEEMKKTQRTLEQILKRCEKKKF